ncbi:MAG: hypothetical protein EXR98_16090 [Gemmataceae bacterium]|nr:hypothetical protein [Gemmataceae bacterium]
MTTLAYLHLAVQTTLASKRLGTPVFARYLYHSPLKGQAIITRLAKTAAAVRDWLNQPLDRVLAQGASASRHITLLLEFRSGATAVVTWVGTTGRGGGVDLTLVGNHGALYHDAGDASLWDEAFTADDAAPDRDLVTLIERAIKSGRPEDVQGGKR